jgi:hypothetical protein
MRELSSNIAEKVQENHPKSLAMLYCEVRHLARPIAYSMGIKNGKVDEICHDVASNIVMLFKKNPGYKIRNYRARIKLEIKHILDGYNGNLNKPRCHWKKAERQAIPISENLPDKKAETDNPQEYIETILSEHSQGARVIIELCRANSYKAAILAVCAITGEAWIRNRADKLRYIYQMVRKHG